MRPKVEINCKFCDKKCKVYQSEIDRGWGLFCSKACSLTSRKVSRQKPCLVCHTLFESRPCQERRGWDKYCSVSCFDLVHEIEPKTNKTIVANIKEYLKMRKPWEYNGQIRTDIFDEIALTYDVKIDVVYRIYAGITYKESI